MRIVFIVLSLIFFLSAVFDFMFLLVQESFEFMISFLMDVLGGVAWLLIAQLWQKVKSLEEKIGQLN